MKLLVASASRHGSTTEIAERIAAQLRAAGHTVDVATAEPSRWLDDEHDGYIIGSSVYFGNWLRDARRFVEGNAALLAGRPVWLFSSGPLGEQPAVGITTGHLRTLTDLTKARSHEVFSGRLRRADLNRFERLVVRITRAPFGDFRDWDRVDRWVAEVDAELAGDAPTSREANGTPRRQRQSEAPPSGGG
jgi:menaquinone-dependent protoporphyrinogen oxidase